MSVPNLNAYRFESCLESAVQSWLLENGINDATKQFQAPIDEDGKRDFLRTPRVECKVQFNGFSTEHMFVNSSKMAYPDIGYGQIYVKVVTRRDGEPDGHDLLRANVRWLMQQRAQIAKFLQYHSLNKILENATTITVVPDEVHDVSAMGFAFAMQIKPELFPQT